ncbi:MAG: hypothetical protein PHC30_02425 [Lentisphaeria bacterium]|nr:hypothetical protein [Lentisphaeria bacterium]
MIMSFFAGLAEHVAQHGRVYFTLMSFFLGLFCAVLAWVASCRLPHCLPWLTAALRSRPAGLGLGVICLAWSAYHACIMLEGDLARFHPHVWTLVPVTAVLSWFFLDFLLARSAGGFLVLAANFLLFGAFVHDVPWRPLYSLACLVLGVTGLFAIGAPWYIRDVLQAAARRPAWARGGAVLLGLMALVLAGLSLMARQ